MKEKKGEKGNIINLEEAFLEQHFTYGFKVPERWKRERRFIDVANKIVEYLLYFIPFIGLAIVIVDIVGVFKSSNNFSKLLRLEVITKAEVFIYFAYVLGFFLFLLIFLIIMGLVDRKNLHKIVRIRYTIIDSIEEHEEMNFLFDSSFGEKAMFVSSPFFIVGSAIPVFLLISKYNLIFQTILTIVISVVVFGMFFVFESYSRRNRKRTTLLILDMIMLSFVALFIGFVFTFAAILVLSRSVPKIDDTLIYFHYFLFLGFIFMSYKSAVLTLNNILRKQKTKKIVEKHFKEKIYKIEKKLTKEKEIEINQTTLLMMAYKKLEINKQQTILPLKFRALVGMITGFVGLISAISGLLTYFLNLL